MSLLKTHALMNARENEDADYIALENIPGGSTYAYIYWLDDDTQQVERRDYIDGVYDESPIGCSVADIKNDIEFDKTHDKMQTIKPPSEALLKWIS